MLIAAVLAGCHKAAISADAPTPARLFVPQHTGARAGNEPVHVSSVEVDGRKYAVIGDMTIELPPGRRELVVAYGRCFHAPTQLIKPGASRSVEGAVGRVTFDAQAGERYVLGCTPGGGGAMIANAHWIEQTLPDGKRKRVADSKMGSDFPQELLGAEPPEPAKSSGAPR